MEYLRYTDAQPPINYLTHHTFLFFYTQFTTRMVLKKRQIIFYPFWTPIGPIFAKNVWVTTAYTKKLHKKRGF
jgi:hypothetical protein